MGPLVMTNTHSVTYVLASVAEANAISIIGGRGDKARGRKARGKRRKAGEVASLSDPKYAHLYEDNYEARPGTPTDARTDARRDATREPTRDAMRHVNRRDVRVMHAPHTSLVFARPTSPTCPLCPT